MPLNNGTPIGNGTAAPWYVAPMHPTNWMDIAYDEFLGVMQSAVMRGQPEAMSAPQTRPRLGPETVPQGTPVWLHSRPYSRGAGAYAPHFGVVNVNPIGAGIYAPYKLPVIAGPGARYMASAIWFNVQSVPTSLLLNPTIPIETVDALISQSYAAAGYRTSG